MGSEMCIRDRAWAYHGGSDNWQTMVFTVLTFCQLAHSLAIRAEKDSLLGRGFFSNLPLLGTVLLTVGLQLMVIYLPVFNQVFRTSPLTLQELAICFSLPLIVLVAVEIEKWLHRKGRIYSAKGSPHSAAGH